MPPRVPCPQGLSTLTLCLRPAGRPSPASLQPLVQRANFLSPREKKRKAKQDPYWWEQSRQRIAANKKRQEELKKARDAAWGDKVHGFTTPFIESLDSAGQAPVSRPPVVAGKPVGKSHPLPTSPELLNYQLSKSELEAAVETAYQLTKPVYKEELAEFKEADAKVHEEAHQVALAAMQRIVSMDHANGKDRRHANIRRCIDTFGRHKTDGFLRQKPPARGANPPEPVPRAGPDTGSSEVQIAILTAKIRVLAKRYEGPKGNKDKHNKRNLRLLLHRRQRLLRYMERKERGSGRWTHMLETLGLTPATWKGQIALE